MPFLFHVGDPSFWQRAVRLVCSAVLCVATWCGPIPWMHRHTLANASPEMAEHISLHHGSAPRSEARPAGELGWHFHLLLLTELGTAPCDEHCPCHGHEPPLPLGLPLAYGVSVLSGIDRVDAPVPTWSPVLDFALVAEVVSISEDDISRSSVGGNAGLAPPIDRLALLGVARC